MFPNVYVSEDFFENVDMEWAKIPQTSIYSTNVEDEDKRKSINRIKDLMLASNIYSDITDKSLVKYHTKQFGTYNNFKDLILNSAIKDSSYRNGRSLTIRSELKDYNQSGFCYFTNIDFIEWFKKSQEIGKIIVGKDFLNSSFYLNNTFASEVTDEKITQISKAKHPCSGLIIIDKYLFDDASSRLPKIPNLIAFLKELIPIEFDGKFQIDIITENKSNDRLFETKINQILESFSNNLSLSVYAPGAINQENDRYLITNYAVFSVGHPFDRNTNVSCNFYPSNNSINDIKNSYNIWKEKVSLALDIINKTPKSIGLYKAIWKSDEIKHSIFEY